MEHEETKQKQKRKQNPIIFELFQRGKLINEKSMNKERNQAKHTTRNENCLIQISHTENHV